MKRDVLPAEGTPEYLEALSHELGIVPSLVHGVLYYAPTIVRRFPLTPHPDYMTAASDWWFDLAKTKRHLIVSAAKGFSDARRALEDAGADPHDWALIYVLRNPLTGWYKIGMSRTSVERRVVTLSKACGVLLEVCLKRDGTTVEEKSLHARFAATRELGEWFRPTVELDSWLAVEQAVAP